jgi:small basic protein
MRTRLALGLYRCLLAFYPTGFRTEFEAEMKAVFTQALGEKRASTARLLWRELCDWPGLVWGAHHAERIRIMMPISSSREQPVPAYQLVPAGSWRDAWLAALAYLLVLWDAAGWAILKTLQEPLQLTNATRNRLNNGITLSILAFLVVMFLLGWRGGWPRWSFPYLGFVLTMGSSVGFSILFNNIWILFYITPLVSIFILMVVALGRWWKGLRALYERVCGDWTLLGLAYFSCVWLVFMFVLNDTRYELGVDLVLSAIFVLGVLAYMRSASLWQRVVALPGAFSAASLVASFYLKAYFGGRQPYFVSDTFRALTIFEVVVILPLLIVGILELWRYTSRHWLQAA